MQSHGSSEKREVMVDQYNKACGRASHPSEFQKKGLI